MDYLNESFLHRTINEMTVEVSDNACGTVIQNTECLVLRRNDLPVTP